MGKFGFPQPKRRGCHFHCSDSFYSSLTRAFSYVSFSKGYISVRHGLWLCFEWIVLIGWCLAVQLLLMSCSFRVFVTSHDVHLFIMNWSMIFVLTHLETQKCN
ncbi:hypothetical protein Mapa_009560 [Marchantia paleacea]|nr:hypothetical protein Mapa_009560 [Marchantia paleacea]